MRRGGVGNGAGWPCLARSVFLGLALVLASGELASAQSLIYGSYELNWDQDVDKTATGTSDIRKLKQILEIKYRGFLSPVVANEATFKVEQEINSNAADVVRILPTLDLDFKARYWDIHLGGKRTHENTDEPGTAAKITESYFVEFFYSPKRKVPDLKLKYTIDTDSQEGVVDTRKDDWTISSVYKLSDWLEIKGDFTHTTNDNRMQPDSDTKDQKRSITVGIRRMINKKIKFDVQYTFEDARTATLLDAGGFADSTEDQIQNVKSAIAFRPFRDTTLDGSYDVDTKFSMVTGEHTLTTNARATLGQKIGKPFDLKLEGLRTVTEARHTVDDNKKTEDTLTAELKAKFSRQLDFTFKYQDKSADEVHADPTKSGTDETVIHNAAWTGELAPFWLVNASYDKTDTYADEVKTQVDTKYSMKSTFTFKAINLILDPSYEITFKDDFVKPESSAVRDFKFKFAYRVLATRTLEAKIEHTYGRKTDSAARNIQRTDNSTGNVTWKNALPGWLLAFDLTRAATDTSGDDLAPDITTTFGFKADYSYKWYLLNASYKYDKKSLTDDAETFDIKTGWAGPKWETTLSYTYNKTFSAILDEGYSIKFTFKYNL